MEHADKGTLKTYLQNLDDPLPLNVVLDLVTGMAKGVKSLHKQNIVHRDIAARNVLVCALKAIMLTVLVAYRHDPQNFRFWAE